MVGKSKNGWLAATAAGVGAIAALSLLRQSRPKFDFQNKVALITGGSRGLGLVLARTLADKGAKLAICARDADELAFARADLQERGARAF